MSTRQSPGRHATLSPADYLGRRSLIVGEVNSGKTTLTGQILEALLRTVAAPQVAVIDLAPTISPEVAARSGVPPGVGGRLNQVAVSGALYLTAPIAAPRLSARNQDQLHSAARRNKQTITALFERFVASGREILFINDLSLYLHSGSAAQLCAWFDRATTVVANGYLGRALGGGVLSDHEQQQMQKLMTCVDQTIHLPERR